MQNDTGPIINSVSKKQFINMNIVISVSVFILLALFLICAIYYSSSQPTYSKQLEESKTRLNAVETELAAQRAQLAELDAEIAHAEGKDAEQIRALVMPKVKDELDKEEYGYALKDLSLLWHEDLKRPEVQVLFERAAKATTKARIDYAHDYEEKKLAAGEDYHVKATGKFYTTLHIQYLLISRPIVYQLEHDSKLNIDLRERGFTRVELNDGYMSGWWYLPTADHLK